MKHLASLAAGLLIVAGLQAQTTQTFSYTGAITTFTVPACVTSLTIEARGAQGGYNTSSTTQPGLGASMIGTFTVTPGQVLKILVGEQPSNSSGNGGGGGTFVTDNSNNPLIIAGGGGGSSQGLDSPDKHGNITTTGGTGAGSGGVGGTNGTGGSIGSTSYFQSGAGGGLLTNGADGWQAGTGGLSFLNGGAGGSSHPTARGGFGGGGNGSSYVVGGGGGGYSGGGSGGNNGAGVGGGGGSYNAGTNQNNTGGVNTGHGSVIITYTAGPPAPASITGSGTICPGGTLSLTAATVVGAVSYTWSVPGSATILTGQGTNQITMTDVAAGTGTVSVTATDGCGPGAPATVTYTVSPAPVAGITTPSTTVCEGSSVTLTASGTGTYAWSTGGTGATETVTVMSQTTYTLVVDNGSCTDTATQTIMTTPYPVAAITTPSTAVCEGSTITLTASGTGTYAWSSGGTGSTETVTVMSQTTYTLTVDNAGCTDTATQTIMTNPNPVVNLGSDFQACDMATLDAQNAGMTYAWSDNTTAQTTTVTSTGTYSVVVTDANGCTGTDEVLVTINALPAVTTSAAMTFVCTGEPTVQLTGSPSGGTWTGAGVFGSTFEPDTAGAGTHDLVYTYTDSLGCTGVDTISITVDLCLGVADADGVSVTVYPNPNNGAFTLQLNNAQGNVVVELLDVNGRVVAAQQLNVNGPQQLDFSGEANGIYLLRVTANGSVNTQRVIIQR